MMTDIARASWEISLCNVHEALIKVTENWSDFE